MKFYCQTLHNYWDIEFSKIRIAPPPPHSLKSPPQKYVDEQ